MKVHWGSLSLSIYMYAFTLTHTHTHIETPDFCITVSQKLTPCLFWSLNLVCMLIPHFFCSTVSHTLIRCLSLSLNLLPPLPSLLSSIHLSIHLPSQPSFCLSTSPSTSVIYTHICTHTHTHTYLSLYHACSLSVLKIQSLSLWRLETPSRDDYNKKNWRYNNIYLAILRMLERGRERKLEEGNLGTDSFEFGANIGSSRWCRQILATSNGSHLMRERKRDNGYFITIKFPSISIISFKLSDSDRFAYITLLIFH